MSKNTHFGVQFDFTYKDDPPRVYIADAGGRGHEFLEVFEDTKCKLEAVEDQYRNEVWSSNPNDWEPGELTKKLVEFMNSLDESVYE